MTAVVFKPTGSVNPKRAEFALLTELLDASIHSGLDLAELAAERVAVDVIDRLSLMA